jgi:hypothetical protein
MLPDHLKAVMELLRAVPHDRQTPFQIGLLTELDTLDHSLTVRSHDAAYGEEPLWASPVASRFGDPFRTLLEVRPGQPPTCPWCGR